MNFTTLRAHLDASLSVDQAFFVHLEAQQNVMLALNHRFSVSLTIINASDGAPTQVDGEGIV